MPYLADYCPSGGTGCPAGPTFWSTVLLHKITTEQYNGTSYVPVDTWTLKQSFPTNNDETTPSLWLLSIAHDGDDKLPHTHAE